MVRFVSITPYFYVHKIREYRGKSKNLNMSVELKLLFFFKKSSSKRFSSEYTKASIILDEIEVNAQN